MALGLVAGNDEANSDSEASHVCSVPDDGGDLSRSMIDRRWHHHYDEVASPCHLHLRGHAPAMALHGAHPLGRERGCDAP
jgi:hypothetical protein